MKTSSSPENRFLLDANISRTIISVLFKQFSFDIKHVSSFLPQPGVPDRSVVDIAKIERRIIITHDLDYGEIYYLQERGAIGVIMLRLRDQTSARVIQRLTEFFTSDQFRASDIRKSLTVLSDSNTRIFTA